MIMGLWNKFREAIVLAAGAILLLVTFYFRGKKQAKTEAKIDKLEEKVAATDAVNKSITDDIKIVTEVEKTVDALPDAAIADRARKWVRKQP